MPLHAAATLDEVYQTLSPSFLIDPDRFEAFYRLAVNTVRGTDRVGKPVPGGTD